jgi:hypothetical protein
VSARGGRVKLVAAVLLAGCVAVPGCAWLRWRSLALTHVDLMERLALDAAESLAAPGRGLEPGDIERLRYPLLRAREFAESSHGRFGDPPWLVAFDRLLSAYGREVDYLDKARTRHIGPRAKEQAHALAQAVTEAAGNVREELSGNRAEATSSLFPSRPGISGGRCRSAGA